VPRRSLALAPLSHLALALAAACSAPRPAPSPAPGPQPAAAPAPAPEPVAYALSPVFEKDALVALQVELRLRGDADGLTRLKLPDHWGTARELWTLLRDFTVEGATVSAADDPSIRQLAAAPNAPLVVRYRVVSGFDHDPHAQDGQPFLPIIRPTWFDLFGEALFAYPEGREDDPATFVWRDAPAGFQFASDLEHLAGARPGVVGDVIESVVIGGPGLRTRANGQVRVAILGDYDFGHDAFFDLSLAVIASQREFWGDKDAPFLITLAPQKRIEGSMTYGGTGRSDAFTLSVAENATIADLRHLLAHEYFHTWNARQLGGQAEGTAEGAGKWVDEGVTEVYTWRLLLRAGIYSLEDFVTAWNEALVEYWTSPVRDEPNARIVADYWNDHAVSRLPYRRGPLLAAIWEQRLRQATAGARDLDDVLQAMRAKVQASPVKLAPDAASVFPPVYRELGGPDIAADLERFVDQGVAIRMPADVFGPCVRVVDSVRRNFERGWDVEATGAAGHVAGLRKGSAAWRAGLRDGMTILERDGKPGDSTVPYVLRVRDGKRERVIRFKPEGDKEIPLQQLELAPGLTPERRAACARELSGA
jgi:predicted metalloprotease with PDZ domain